MPAPRRGTTNDKSASSLRHGSVTMRSTAMRQHGSTTTCQCTDTPANAATTPRCGSTAVRKRSSTALQQHGRAIRHFSNTPFRQWAITAMRSTPTPPASTPHPAHSACRTASAPIRHGNSRAAHTHSHIVHAHSRTPHRMGHAHSHILPYRMDQTVHPPGSTGRGYMSPCRMDRTNAHVRKCLNGASLQRFGLYMSENARMGPVFPSHLIAATTNELRKPRSKL